MYFLIVSINSAKKVIYCVLLTFYAGLFHGAILQSGSEMAFWSLHRPEEKPENYFRQVADQFNCTTTDTTEMVECLRLIDAVALNYARFECTVSYLYNSKYFKASALCNCKPATYYNNINYHKI